MNDSAPRLAFLSRMAYGDTASDDAVQALQDLVGLKDTGQLEIGPNILPELLPEVPAQLEHNCHALVCRPTWGGQVTEELVQRLRIPGERFAVATLSSGTSHISAEETEDTKIFYAREGNAEQTAELTIFLAICLLRRALAPMVNMGFGVYLRPESSRTRSLNGLNWLVVGPGTIGEAVLRKASAMGVGSVRAYYQRFAQMEENEIERKYGSLIELGVELTADLDSALADVDVVTVHVPANEDTIGMIDDAWFERLPEKAVLVNCARHEVVDADALVAALKANKIRGYAADVLPPRSERRGANPHLPDVELWRRACWSLITSIERCTHGPSAFQDVTLAERFLANGRSAEQSLEDELRSERNMVYTPHIGGSTHDAELAVATEVIEDLQNWLGITR